MPGDGEHPLPDAAAFRLLAENADDIVGRHDPDGTWRWVSPSVERATGHRPAELLGRSPLDLVHPDDHASLLAAVGALDAEHPATRLAVRLVRTDGAARWFAVRLRRVVDPGTGLAQLHSTHQDVHDERRAHEELERFRELANRSGDLIAIAAADGECLYVNPTGRRLMGLATDDPPSRLRMTDGVAPAEQERFAAIVALVDREGSWAGTIDLVGAGGAVVPVRQEIVAHRDPAGQTLFYSTVAQDLRERHRGEERLHAERELYRTLVRQVPVAIWRTDRAGSITFVNAQLERMAGVPAERLVGRDATVTVHPDDVDRVAASWKDAVRAGVRWQADYRMVPEEGGPGEDGPGEDGTGPAVREVSSTARPLRDAAGGVAGFLGTTTDVTGLRRAERDRREAATDLAARRVCDAASARVRAMVEGLAAIVWEVERVAGSGELRHTYVSDRAEELLGHPAAALASEPPLWPRYLHPDDRDAAVALSARRVRARADHDVTVRAVAVDGRVVWLHQVVHVVTGPDGGVERLQGLAVDVTRQRRAEHATALLAEAGRVAAEPGGIAERLDALVRLIVHELGDAAVVSLAGPDGLLRRAAVAHADPDTERALYALAPSTVPPEVAAAVADGGPVVLTVGAGPDPDRDGPNGDGPNGDGPDGDGRHGDHPHGDEPHGDDGRHGPDRAEQRALDVRTVLATPLVVRGELAGVLAFPAFGRPRRYGPDDIDLAAELARRAGALIADDRARRREEQQRLLTAELASADTLDAAARVLVGRLGPLLGALAVGVYRVDADRAVLRLVHQVGFETRLLSHFRSLRCDAAVPIALAARTGAPSFIHDRAEWARDWPHLVEDTHPGRHAAAALPLVAAGRVVGVIAASFDTPRVFSPDETDELRTLVALAAPALERAAAADERRALGETLQRALLPAALPELARLGLAARYRPGARGTQAGGDWYEVLPLPGDLVALVVGDVVGQGAYAAAVMGQLRSALSAYLLAGYGPVAALELLDAFAARTPGATGSTVACLTLAPATGELEWASAGHLPPLLTGPGGARLLDGANGTVLGVRGRPPYVAARATVAPGDSLVLYTDGLVERRDEVVDDGLDRLAGVAAGAHAADPESLAEILLAGEEGPGPADDVALVVARLVPAPLRMRLPTEPGRVAVARAAVRAWSAAAALGEHAAYDLELAVGEAVSNAVEHARATAVTVDVAREAGGRVRVAVGDDGTWRPPPADAGHRGRGIALVRAVGTDVEVVHGTGGTTVRFVIRF